MGPWNADDIGLTPDDYRSLAWEHDRYMLEQRWKALKTIWGRPVVDEWQTKRRTDGVICYDANRVEECTLWTAAVATIAIIMGRYWHDAAERRWRSKKGRYAHSRDIAYWDAHSVYGGYTVDCCWLYPGCRVSIFNDGETNL